MLVGSPSALNPGLRHAIRSGMVLCLRALLFSSAVLTTFLLHGHATSVGIKAIDVGDRKQLFIDKRFIESGSGVELVMNPPVKRETVIKPDQPWDSAWIVGYGTVLEDEGKYKMYYTVLPPVGAIDQNEDAALLCYAESADGIQWNKPSLGIFEWHGSKANNILLRVGIETSTVFVDPNGTPDKRYKMLANRRGPNGYGVYIYTSRDGLHWALDPTLLFPFWPDSQNQAFYDERLRRYVIYVRQWAPLRKVGRIETSNILQPWPYDASKVSARTFGDQTTPPGTQIPTAFGYDSEDPQPSDFYTSAAVPYAWAADVYLMFPSAYLHFPDPPKSQFKNDGPVDIEMAVSRDGVAYTRVERKPYVELGLDGYQDAGSIYMLVGMIRRGDEISQYYSAYPFTHGGYHGFSIEHGIGAIVRLSQRLDGFVSADTTMAGGGFMTPLIQFEGKRLVVNMNASAMGEMFVELRDANAKPIPGYSFADSDPLHANHIRQVVSWGGKTDLSTVDHHVRIAFRSRSAKLYAFQFER